MSPIKRQPGNRYRSLALPVTLAILASAPKLLPAATDDTYIGLNQGLWSVPGNWSAGVPNNIGGNSFNAIIDTPAGITVQLNSNVTINTLTVGASDVLSSAAGLTIAAGSISNSGTIVIDKGSTGASLRLLANTTLSGGGTVTLANPQSAIYSDGTRLTTDNVIIGQGRIGLGSSGGVIEFTNSGTITASGGILYIGGPTNGLNPVSYNSGLINARNGTLGLSTHILDNTGGVIEVSTGSSYGIGGTLTGGTIHGLGGTLTLDTGANVDFTGELSLGSGAIFNGGVTNYGTLTLPGTDLYVHGMLNNANVINTKAYFNMLDGSTLAGDGVLVLKNSNIRAGGQLGGHITTDTTIMGSGVVGGSVAGGIPFGMIRIKNTGTIIASTSTGTMTLVGRLEVGGASGFVNQGTLRADGGTLVFANTLFDNTAGTIESLHGSPVIINGTVNGGTILSNGIVTFNASSQVGAITGSGSLTIAPAVSLTSDGVLLSHLQINGTHTIRPNSGESTIPTGTSKLSTLTLAGSPDNWTSKLDLTNNALILQTTNPSDKAAKLATLQNQIAQAAGNGTWHSLAGITSSTVAADSTTSQHTLGLALADNATLKLTTFNGQSVDENSLIITPAHLADSTLDGKVDSFDLNTIASHWQQSSGALWSDGDTTGPNNIPDGKVDAFDLNALASFWQFNSSSAFAPALALPSSSTVPEPASLALLALGGTLMLKRRR